MGGGISKEINKGVKKVCKEVNRVARHIQINEKGGLPRFKWRNNGRSEGRGSFFGHGRTPEEEAAATRAEIEREIETARAVRVAAEEARLNLEVAIAECASRMATQLVELALVRYNQADADTKEAQQVLAHLNTQATDAEQQVKKASAAYEQAEERAAQRIRNVSKYSGGLDAIEMTSDSEFADARASISEAKTELEAAQTIQIKTQEAVQLATEQLKERERLQDEARSYYNTTLEYKTNLANQAANAKQTADQKTRELTPLAKTFQQQAAQAAANERRPMHIEAAARLPDGTPPPYLGPNTPMREAEEKIEVARKQMAKLAAENLVRQEERLKVAVTVTQRALEKVKKKRVAPAKAIYDSAQRNTKRAGIRLARLTVKAEIAKQRFESASDSMAKTVVHRLLIEEKTELRRKDASQYPGGIEVVEITSASELEAARVVSFQAEAKRNAALDNQRETEKAVRLAEEQLIEREKLEKEARLYHEQTLCDQADFASQVAKAEQAVTQKTQELAHQTYTVSPVFRQQAEQAAKKTEEQLQTEAAARLYVKQEPTKFTGIDRCINKAQENMQVAQEKMKRLAAQTEAQRNVIERINTEINAETKEEFSRIGDTHKTHVQEYAIYLPENHQSFNASVDVWALKNLILRHDGKQKEKINNIYQHEREAGVLATTYYAKIEAAAEIAVKEAERELARLERNPANLGTGYSLKLMSDVPKAGPDVRTIYAKVEGDVVNYRLLSPLGDDVSRHFRLSGSNLDQCQSKQQLQALLPEILQETSEKGFIISSSLIKAQGRLEKARRELTKLVAQEEKARRAVEEKIPNAGQFLVDDATLQREVIFFDKEAQKKLIKKHEEVEAKLQAEQHEKKIKENQPIPRPALTAQQMQELSLLHHNKHDLVKIVLNYMTQALSTKEHDIFRLNDVTINWEDRLFLWDVICIAAVHSKPARRSANENEKALRQMQLFAADKDTYKKYKESLVRMSQRCPVTTKASSVVLGPEKFVDIPIDNTALQTADKTVKCFKQAAERMLPMSSNLFNPEEKVSDRGTQDSKFSAGVAAIEEAAASTDVTKRSSALFYKMIHESFAKTPTKKQSVQQMMSFK